MEAQNGDARTQNMKAEMARNFVEYEAEYRAGPRDAGAFNNEIVHEDENCIVVADHSGHELNEWASVFDVSRSELSQIMHGLARDVCDYNWSTSDPVVFDKLGDE